MALFAFKNDEKENIAVAFELTLLPWCRHCRVDSKTPEKRKEKEDGNAEISFCEERNESFRSDESNKRKLENVYR